MGEKPSNKSIMEVLRRIDRGQFLNDLDQAIRDGALAIEENGGGSASLTIKIKMKSKAKTDAMQISGELATTLPKRVRIDAIMFLDPETSEIGALDKRQPALPSVVDADELNERRQRSNLRGGD
jgi:hypothetical protein